MRRVMLIPICLALIIAQQVRGQENPQPIVTDCNTILQTDTTPYLEPFAYTYACETGYDCFYTEPYQLCHFQLAGELLKSCAADDWVCQDKALLDSIAVYVLGDAPFGYFQPPQSLVDRFPQVLNAVSTGDFASAQALLQDFTIIESELYPLLPYSRGVVYELMAEPDNALQAYDEVLVFMPSHPLIHYGKGLLYGRIGRNLEASFETAWVDDFLTAFAPDLLPLAAPLRDAYPLDRSRLSTWVEYPVMRKIASPVGEGYSDLTQTPSRPVQIGIYDELDALLAIDVSLFRFPRFSGDVPNTYLFNKTGDQQYRYVFPASLSQRDMMKLEFKDGLIFGIEREPGVEGYVDTQFIIAPPDDPDPRQVFGEPACEGGVISRLRPGMAVHERGYSGGLYYATTPGGSIDQFFDDGYRGDMTDSSYPWLIVTVTDHFTCIGDALWWEVTDGLGHTGWRAENSGTTYEINPKVDLQELFYCPASLPARLYIDAKGRVLPGLGVNNLRAEPGMASERTATIPEGGEFTVLDGPVCNGMVWWRVQYGDHAGWTVEGDSGVYWVEPILPG